MTKRNSLSIALKSINQSISLADDILFKDKQQINDEALALKLKRLREIANEVSNFFNFWNEAGFQEGFVTPERMVDTKLISTDRLDVNQLKKTIVQINMADIAIRGLDCVSIHIDDFLAQLQGQQAEKCLEEGKLLKELLGRTKSEIEKDAYTLRQQRDNASLYYQIFMVSRAVKIAYGSLFASSLAVLLIILQAVHIL